MSIILKYNGVEIHQADGGHITADGGFDRLLRGEETMLKFHGLGVIRGDIDSALRRLNIDGREMHIEIGEWIADIEPLKASATIFFRRGKFARIRYEMWAWWQQPAEQAKEVA